MSSEDFKVIHPARIDELPDDFFARRGCSRCLYWEDANFFTGNDPEAILATKKQSWFDRVRSEFGDPSIALYAEDEVVAFTEFALPKHLPGLAEYEVQPIEGVPFVACFAVRLKWRGQGLGRNLLNLLKSDLEARGYDSLQTIARISSANNPSGPLGFWAAVGAKTLCEAQDYALVTIDISKG